MRLRFVTALVRHEVRQFVRDPSLLVFFVGLPLVLAAFLEPAFQPLLAADDPAADGAEQAIPGMTVLFSLFVVVYAGFGVFREHGWRTWDRLRMLSSHPLDVLVGKAFVPLALVLCQFGVMSLVGVALFDLPFRGSLAAGALVIVSFGLFLVTFGLMLGTLCRTIEQMSAVSGLLTITMAAVGGAIVPIDAVASWAHPVRLLSPAYWAMQGLGVTVSGGDPARAVGAAAALAGFSAVAVAVTVVRFDAGRAKTSWSY